MERTIEDIEEQKELFISDRGKIGKPAEGLENFKIKRWLI